MDDFSVFSSPNYCSETPIYVFLYSLDHIITLQPHLMFFPHFQDHIITVQPPLMFIKCRFKTTLIQCNPN